MEVGHREALRGLAIAVALMWAAHANAADGDAIPPGAARSVFDEAKKLCERDAGKLWGKSLCAPIMLVNADDRSIVASARDAGGLLEARDGVFVGKLPNNQGAANTSVEWSGTRWTQMLWPLPDDPGARAVLLMHESFHNLQPRLGVPLAHAGDNVHLDTHDGRYWLQLEWRALAAALQAKDERARRTSVVDALAFRHARHSGSADAERNETALELNEGLAEYTGIAIAYTTDRARTEAALHDLAAHVGDASFVRSFAYATGPAYGLLLDRHAPGWRQRLNRGDALPALLAQAMHVDVDAAAKRAGAAAGRYDPGRTLQVAEMQRERVRQQSFARNRKKFVNGPVLVLALKKMQVQFDPRKLQSLDEAGTVYPKLRVSDDWGMLEVDDGALMKKDWSAVVVGAPVLGNAPALHGEGWKLDLAPGWKIESGPRTGDFVMVKAPATP